MRRMLSLIFVSLLGCALADIYMHYPRGSNNRLNENTAQRTNANRAFDSQNNNRGGYNVGEKSASASKSYSNQYHETYFTSSPESRLGTGKGSSYLNIEWTNQHGCGGDEDKDPHKLNCNIVIQYICQDTTKVSASNYRKMRNGQVTTTTPYNGGNKNKGRSADISRMYYDIRYYNYYGMQEQWAFYKRCSTRDRNKGLFTADQYLKGTTSIYTRQNPQGTRRGYECPEERDYYPFWHPTEWKDIAVLAENASRCSFYQKESFNVKPRYECIEKDGSGHYQLGSKYNNQRECEANRGQWLPFYNYLEKATHLKTEAACTAASKKGVKYIWGRPIFVPEKKECLVALPAPDCKAAMWSRVNHLGNGRGGQPLSYKWKLPHFPSGNTHRCFLRIRYNITTDDYDPVRTDYRYNNDSKKGTFSPVENDPQVTVGAMNSPLQLAINTAQFGRTFQDRSHLFLLKKRPSTAANSKTIHHLSVRGKRGNIVQVFPAVEYDFFPTNLTIKSGELVHIQWAGANTHTNNAPGGDGQAGAAGQGTAGTDRHNLVQIDNLNSNFPLPFEKVTMFKNATVLWTATLNTNVKKLTSEDLAVILGSGGYYLCSKTATCGSSYSVQSKTQINDLLNNVPASFHGILLEFAKGMYHYMCTRNNNFTNRSQKGTLKVE